MGKQYSSEKRTEAFRGNQHTAKKSGSVQSEHNQKPMKTCERIAQENHSSASSVRRAEYYAHGVDVADELSPGFRDRFFREELHIPDYLLENLGKAKPEEQAEIFKEIKNYVPKPKKVKPNKVTVKQAEKAASNTIDENYGNHRATACKGIRRDGAAQSRKSNRMGSPDERLCCTG